MGFTLKTNSDNTTRIAMANFVKDDLAKVGVRVTLAPVDFNTLITNIQSDFQYEAILLGLQSGVPPDPGMMGNVWRSSGFTHFWNPVQPKPETPEEARIDKLMDELTSTQDASARKRAYENLRNHRERAGMVYVAAHPPAEGPCQQPLREPRAQHSASPHPLER